MYFTKLLNIMNDLFPVSIPQKTLENLSKLNPNKFYLENVRSIMDVSYDKAKSLCEIAVRQGYFTCGIEILCPDGSVAKSIEQGQDLPEKVNCLLLVEGGYEDVELNVTELERNTYYKLNQ
jgi:hypothetical protein